MAPVYKFTYFNLMGLGEPIRFILSYGGIEFEDERVVFEEWVAMKPTTPFGQLPILEVDGKKLNQSVAIARYLGKQLKLAGSNDLEAAEIDAIVDSIQDMRSKISAYLYEPESNEKKAKMLEVLLNDTLPFYLEKLDAVAKANNNHFVGDQLTWGDIFFIGLLEYLCIKMKFDLVEKYSSLKAMREEVLSSPGIKNWVANRPKTDF